MRDLLRAARTRLGLAIGGAALLAAGVGVGAAAVTHPATSTVSDVAPVVTDTPAVTTSSASTSAAPTSSAVPVAVAPKVAQAPADAPGQSPQPATVETVTTPDPAPAEPTNDPSIGTIGPDGNYVPANPIQSAGAPPYASPLPQPVAPCLPGETSARCTPEG